MVNPYTLSDQYEQQYELDDGFERFSRRQVSPLNKRRERHIARMVTAHATAEDFACEGITRGEIFTFFDRRRAKLQNALTAMQAPHAINLHHDLQKRIGSSLDILLAGMQSPVCHAAVYRHVDMIATVLKPATPKLNDKAQQLSLRFGDVAETITRPDSYAISLDERRRSGVGLQEDRWRVRSQQTGLRARKQRLG